MFVPKTAYTVTTPAYSLIGWPSMAVVVVTIMDNLLAYVASNSQYCLLLYPKRVCFHLASTLYTLTCASWRLGIPQGSWAYVALAHLASLKRALGDLDRVTAWLRVFAMVNAASGFNQTPLVTNGYSDLILEVYGPEVGMHARSSIGMMLPLNAPVNCEAEVEIDG